MAEISNTGELIIPGTELILPRAYEGRKELLRVIVQEGIAELPDYAFSECRNLAEAVLPQSARKLGNHTFYNCRSLSALSVPAKLESIGDGTFKNCAALSKITFCGMQEGADQCVRKILFDIEQETELTLIYGDGTAKLIMPQYDYQYVANEPARIFSEVSYGTGHYYRKCINSMEIQFREYDRLFDMARRENSARTVSEICLARLMYPYRLMTPAAEQYKAYLTEKFPEVAERLIWESAADRNALEKLCSLGDCGVLTEDNMPAALEIAGRLKNAEAVSWLMEYKRVHFAPKRKEFDL